MEDPFPGMPDPARGRQHPEMSRPQRRRAQHPAVHVLTVVRPAAVRVRRTRQPLSQRAGQLAAQLPDPLGASLPVRALGSRLDRACLAVADLLQDLQGFLDTRLAVLAAVELTKLEFREVWYRKPV